MTHPEDVPSTAELLEELYLSAYINHEELDDIEPGYEYAVQQLCSELIDRTELITKDEEIVAMERAQERFDALVADAGGAE